MISLPPGTKIFQFPGLAILSERPYGQVSPFGNSRVKAYSAAHRDLSQPYHALHRLSVPRHPPCTLSNFNFFLNSLDTIATNLRSSQLRSRIMIHMKIIIGLLSSVCQRQMQFKCTGSPVASNSADTSCRLTNQRPLHRNRLLIFTS